MPRTHRYASPSHRQARRRKRTLFVTFIDFTKAYDLVKRERLFQVLRRLGCGIVMLGALVSMYCLIENIIGTAVVTVTLGLRKGSPTSSIFFVLSINDLIKLLKEKCSRDGFLKWLHILVLMDDTILLATTRKGMLMKVKLLQDYCEQYGMITNPDKTRFLVVNGSDMDWQPLVVNSFGRPLSTVHLPGLSIYQRWFGFLLSKVTRKSQDKSCFEVRFLCRQKQ